MAVSAKRLKIDLIILLLVLVGGLVATIHAQAVGDWVHTLKYDPPSEIVQLADDAGMSDRGKRLFYRYSPMIVDKAMMNRVCGPKLGCTEGQHIYILQSNTDREYDRNIVTAAHEMLHIAWSRLGQADKQEVADAMTVQLGRPSARQTHTEVDRYKADDYLEDYINEALAYTGSEVGDIPTDLEAFYSPYFTDRQQSTAAYQKSPEDIE